MPEKWQHQFGIRVLKLVTGDPLSVYGNEQYMLYTCVYHCMSHDFINHIMLRFFWTFALIAVTVCLHISCACINVAFSLNICSHRILMEKCPTGSISHASGNGAAPRLKMRSMGFTRCAGKTSRKSRRNWEVKYSYSQPVKKCAV